MVKPKPIISKLKSLDNQNQSEKKSYLYRPKVQVWVLFIFSFILYVNTIKNDFSLDDIFVTTQNTTIQKGFKAIPEILKTPYLTINNTVTDYRPVVKIVFAIESQLFGTNPYLSHFIQALIYGLCCVALYKLLKKIFYDYHTLFIFITCIFFAAHPLHTEVVASLKSRDELLSFFFSITALHFFTKGFIKEKSFFIVIGFIFLMLALLSKASSLIIILWIPLIFYYLNSKKKPIAYFLPVIISVIISFGLYVFEQQFILNGKELRTILFIENPLVASHNFFQQIGLILNSLWFYSSKMIFPHPLGWFYGYDTIPLRKSGLLIPYFSFFFHTTILLIGLVQLRKRTIWSFSILIYLIALSPFINLLTLFPGIVAERASFFSSLGFCLVLAAGIFKLSNGNIKDKNVNLKPMSIIAILLILIPYSSKVISRNNDWKNTFSILEADMLYLKHSATANQVYAIELQKRFQQSTNRQADSWMLEKAFEHFQQSLKIYPNNPQALMRCGEIIGTEYNKLDEAMNYFQKALKLDSSNAQLYFDIAFCNELNGNYPSALKNYKTSLKLDSNYIEVWQNISVLFSKMGMNDSALIYNQRLIDMDSNSEHGNANAGFFYKNIGDNKSAIHYFEKALKINQNRTDIKVALDSIKQKSSDPK